MKNNLTVNVMYTGSIFTLGGKSGHANVTRAGTAIRVDVDTSADR